ncbi:isoleucine--tRNA ligase [Actinomadura sp. NBRC 104425]|uniref:isoleucine--tRNA ligase n=1 Tax=Actinomadura sp. NBRC 104425 TaxID=3032204 RepID=UPI0024A1D619|nr:isoleucine--tRNA ligase [Actinomadura sp. NBRC 104425]GLZ10763.1 isoleucine--tRNA ligase [Actinomadura sp. NBRC 104425]
MYPRDGRGNAVEGSPSFPQVEREILDLWAEGDTFRRSVEARPAGQSGSNEYVFYDGPPFANGLPHYGHLLTGYIKDVIPRYRTMLGRRVERRFGWDCHGLPAEVEAEKQLGISTKTEILDMGVKRFNDACRESVLRYVEEWERYVTRQARWVDFDNDYKTLDLNFMESVMWAFKTLYDKGLIYEGFQVLAYCWRCETPLSNAETGMDDSYRERVDPSVTVGFELETGETLLVWTTTPWTLPSNLAVAVGPDIDYAVVAHDGKEYIIAEARLGEYRRQLAAEGAEPDVVRRLRGADLVGRSYRPPFDFLAGTENAFRVLAGDFVTTDSGTGIVHMAPAFGEDDQRACSAAGIPTVVTVDDAARFTSQVPDYAGQQVFDANKQIVRDLRARGALLRHDSYTHSYPHCWRCDTPLIYKAMSSWFVAVTKFRDRMVELNEQIDWVPGHVKKGAFGKWLEGARDWSISRNRFWGSPIPVWKSDNPDYPRVDVYGSLDEIERDFGVRPADLHRPGVDELVRPNPDDPTGKSMMRRVPAVLDCWFESGSMPFAQVHYPFENGEWFDDHYPGDFIVEYQGQTRAWFYYLHVLATALFDRPAFRTCLAHGILLGEDGRKMSKKLRNYPDVYEMFDRYGADAMRWFLLSSPVVSGGDMPVTEAGIRDAVRQVIKPMWNAWHFFALYANATPYEARLRTDSEHVLDRYILVKTGRLVREVRADLDGYALGAACQRVRQFLDTLTNWYVRRSRARFWDGDADAFDTLYTVLETLLRVAAPLLPLTTEKAWRGLTGGESVHLTDWPDDGAFPADDALADGMDRAREVCSAALSLRKAADVRVRLPLRTLTVAAADADTLRPYLDLVADEVNVKSVELSDDAAGHAERVLTVLPRVLGPRLGKDTQKVIRAVKSGDWQERDGRIVAGGVELEEGEYETRLVPRDSGQAALIGDGVVVLDTEVTPELRAEGLARDLVRVIQTARRESGLHVSDRITVAVGGSSDVAEAVQEHGEFIARETLAEKLSFGDVPDGAVHTGEVGDGDPVTVAVQRV